MLYLKCLSSESVDNASNERAFYPSAVESIVGRNACDLNLTGDKSVSRKHARLIRTQARGVLALEDLESKYGTYVLRDGSDGDYEQIDGRTEVRAGDAVRFGLLENRWLVAEFTPSVCFSTMRPPDALLETLKKIGARVQNEWTAECTHLTMPSVTLTVKTVGALVAARPIVEPRFWDECRRRIERGRPPPEEADFAPRMDEPTLDPDAADFRPDPCRRTLFGGRTFLFLSRGQTAKYSPAIEAGGGACRFLGAGALSKSELTRPGVAVVRPPLDQLSQDDAGRRRAFDDIVRHLRGAKMRAVPEAEIGLAALAKSLERHCNPRFDFAATLTRNPGTPEDAPRRTPLAPDTEETAPPPKSPAPRLRVEETPPSARGAPAVPPTPETPSSPFPSGTSETPSGKLTIRRKTRRDPAEEERPSKMGKTDENPFGFVEDGARSENAPPENGDLFNFVLPAVAPETGALNLKRRLKNRTTAKETPVADDDPFGFIPENPANLIFENRPKEAKRNTNGPAPKAKRLCLKSSPKTEESSIRPLSSSMASISLDGRRWFSRNEPSDWIGLKKEKPEPDEVDNGPAERPAEAIIIINDSLIKKRDNPILENHSNRNFKKFVKVVPVNPKSTFIPRRMISICESQQNGSSNLIHSDDDNDEVNEMQFRIMTQDSKGKKNKTRRL